MIGLSIFADLLNIIFPIHPLTGWLGGWMGKILMLVRFQFSQAMGMTGTMPGMTFAMWTLRLTCHKPDVNCLNNGFTLSDI